MKRLFEDLDQHIDHLIDLASHIEFGKVTILTGPNASGKSMIRRLISVQDPDGMKIQTASTSMQQRTSSNPEWGALSSALQDTSWTATSMNTWRLLKGLLEIDNRYLVVDEPEIGVGREVLLGITDRINAAVKDKRDRGVFCGLCVITHSDFVVRNIKADNFVNIGGMTEKEWLGRQIDAVDPDDVDAFGGELMKAIENRMEENRKSKQNGG